MSFVKCECGTLGNTGIPASNGKFGDVTSLIFTKKRKNDGTKNFISNSDVIDSTYLTTKLNATDGSKWFLVGNLDNPIVEFNSVREDPTYETFADTSRSLINANTNRPMTGMIKQIDAHYGSKIDSFNCEDYAVYQIDGCGNLRGDYNSNEDAIYPIGVQKNTTYTRPIDTSINGGTTQKLMFGMDFQQNVKDTNLAIIPASEITADILGANGLFDVTASDASAISLGGFTIDLFLDYKFGFESTRTPATGWTSADFVLTNAGVDVGLLSVTESATVEGRYAITFADQVASDVVVVTSNKDGFVLRAKNVTITA